MEQLGKGSKMSRLLAPIVLFVYNRLDHTVQTIKALQKNKLADESDLFIYSDAAKSEVDIEKVDEVRKFINSIAGFKNISIIERDENFGLANSIIDGVTNIVNKYGKIIVLEDDIITSPLFLEYINNVLDVYENEDDVSSVSGYMFPIEFPQNEFYFLPMISSWGWGTWKKSWDIFEPNGQKLLKIIQDRGEKKAFNLDNTYPYLKMLKNQIKGKNNSWAIRWNASLFVSKKLSVWPSKSLVDNIGFDGSGTHCNIDYYSKNNIFSNKQTTIFNNQVSISEQPYNLIKKYLIEAGLSQLSIRKVMLKLISLCRK